MKVAGVDGQNGPIAHAFVEVVDEPGIASATIQHQRMEDEIVLGEGYRKSPVTRTNVQVIYSGRR